MGVAPPELTVAVKITVCPTVDGFGPEVNVVVVAALLTFCVTVPELVAKLAYRYARLTRRDQILRCF